MRFLRYLILGSIICGVAQPTAAGGLNDKFGKPDIITIEIAPLQTPGSWALGVYLENDEPLAAITVPLLFGDRVGQFKLDSVLFTNTRTWHFGLRTTNSYDTLNSVLIGLLYTLGGDELPLDPGYGPVAWVYLTSYDSGAALINPPRIDSTFFPPFNRLELVTPSAEPIKPIFETKLVEKLTEYGAAKAPTSSDSQTKPR